MSKKLDRVRNYFISRQVFEALQPLFFLTFLYGLTPFRMVKHKKSGSTRVKMSCFGFANIGVYIILYGTCYIWSLLKEQSMVGYFLSSQIAYVTDTMQTCNGLITGTVIYVSAVTQRRKLLRTIDILHSLDENFFKIGIKVKYSHIYRFSLVMIVFKMLVISVYFIGVFRLLQSGGIYPPFCICVTFFLQHSVLSIAICLFCFIARSFERRLLIMNKVGFNIQN